MRIAEVPSCSVCPWVWWAEGLPPVCHHPDTLDKLIEDEMEIPKWCCLDELLEIEEDDE